MEQTVSPTGSTQFTSLLNHPILAGQEFASAITLSLGFGDDGECAYGSELHINDGVRTPFGVEFPDIFSAFSTAEERCRVRKNGRPAAPKTSDTNICPDPLSGFQPLFVRKLPMYQRHESKVRTPSQYIMLDSILALGKSKSLSDN